MGTDVFLLSSVLCYSLVLLHNFISHGVHGIIYNKKKMASMGLNKANLRGTLAHQAVDF
jgi:hypothetical protein